MSDFPPNDDVESDELTLARPFDDDVDDVDGVQLLARLQASLFGRPAEPRTLGRWLILERRGAGAMGVVYAAYDPRLDRRVALKVLRGNRGDRVGAQARMLREAQALAKISDPHVLHIYDVEELEGNVCLVMELIEGTTLEAWQREPRRLAEILDRYVAVAHGLAKIHEAGLVHRDVKPSNVLVDGSRVVIADFGLVLAEDAVGPDSRASQPELARTALELTLTEDGALVGTLGYMAPELLSGAGASARSDQFAFWVSFYEAVTGVRPFRGATPRAVAEAMSLGTLARSPRGVPVPRWLYQLMQRGLLVEPGLRFESMVEVEAVLERGRHRGRRARNLLLVVLGGGLAALGYGLRGEGAPASPVDPAQKCAAELSDRRMTLNLRDVMPADDALARSKWEALAQVFEARAAKWHGELLDACLRSASPAAGPELRRRTVARDECLVRNEAVLRVTAERLAQADDTTRDLAVLERLAGDLTALPDCVEASGAVELEGGAQEPEAVVVALEQARAAEAFGDNAEAEALAAALASEAHTSGLGRVEGEARYLRGRALSGLGRPLDARESLELALDEAARVGDRELGARSAVFLAKVVANDLQDAAGGRTWLSVARHELVAAGRYEEAERGALFADYVEARAFVAFTERDWVGAEGLHREALGLRQALASQGAPSADVLKSKNNLANVLSRLDRKTEALVLYREALDEAERRYGPQHPYCADAWSNIGNVLMAQGQLDEAADAYRRAVSIHRSGRGDRGVAALRGLLALGVVAQLEGDEPMLIDVVGQIESIHARVLADDPRAMAHPDRADELQLVAAARQGQGDIVGVLDALRRAAALLEPVDPVGHAFAQLNIARVLHEQRRDDEARPLLEHAIPVLREAVLDGPDADDLALAEDLLQRLRD